MVFFSNIASLLADGVRVPERQVERIGIRDGSRCWGLWAPVFPLDRHRPGARQLVIAPFHPVSWPFLVRINMKLAKRNAAMRDASKTLEKLGFNIVATSLSPSGPHHADWNVIVEDVETRRTFQARKEQLDREYPFDRAEVKPGYLSDLESQLRSEGASERVASQRREDVERVHDAFLNARALADDIGEEILFRVASLKAALIEANRETRHGGFMHPRIVERKWFLYGEGVPEKVEARVRADERLSGLLKLHGPMNGCDPEPKLAFITPFARDVSVYAIFNLPFFALYGGSPEAPISFVYDAASSMLRVDSGARLDFSFVDPARVAPPPEQVDSRAFPIGVVTFDTSEHSLRVFPVARDYVDKRMVKIFVDYSVLTGPGQGTQGGGSQGLLRRICKKIAKAGILIHLTTNQTLEYGYNRERGRLEFVGTFNEGVSPEARAARGEDLRRSLLGLTKRTARSSTGGTWRDVEITRVEIGRINATRVFVSMRFEHPREENIVALLHKAARAVGVEIFVVRTYTREVTRSIRSRMEQSDALLQLLYLRPGESAEVPSPTGANLAWLDFEYGLAMGRGLVSMRLVDESSMPYERWRQREVIDRDHDFKSFRLDSCDEELLQVFREALETLAAQTRTGWRSMADKQI